MAAPQLNISCDLSWETLRELSLARDWADHVFYVKRIKCHGYVLDSRLPVNLTEYLGFLSVCVLYCILDYFY